MEKLEAVRNYFGDNIDIENITEKGMDVVMPKDKAEEIGATIKEERGNGNVLANIRYFKSKDSNKRVIEPLEYFQKKQRPSAPESEAPGGVTLE